jgi:rRNA maturation endonuclease Nob1
MALIRCAGCRYSFEHAGDEPPTSCPQCGDTLRPSEAPARDDERKDLPTQPLQTIAKPKE